MHDNIDGIYNTAVGAGALTANQFGSTNTAVGFGALHENKSSNNTAIGSVAMWSNVNGYSNVAIGDGALNMNVNGYSNTAIGYEAMHEDTASENTAIGYQAMISNISGTANVAIGQTALRENVEGSYNTAVGWDAMKNASGSNNAAFGPSALKENLTGNSNVAIGLNALISCIDGSNNTMVGTEADFAPEAPTDIYNSTALGYSAEVTESDQIRLGNNDIQTLFCMGAYNSVTYEELPNLYVSPDGQIMRAEIATKFPGFIKVNLPYDLPAMPANSSWKAQFQVTGCQPGETVFVSPAAELPDGLVIGYARVSDPGTVEVKFTNSSGSVIDPVMMEFSITVLK